MEKMFLPDNLNILFIHDNNSKDFNKYMMRVTHIESPPYKKEKEITNNEKIKQIFDYFRESSEKMRGGGLSLDDFKRMIKRKIVEIIPKISQ
jgi:hypothetical protein